MTQSEQPRRRPNRTIAGALPLLLVFALMILVPSCNFGRPAPPTPVVLPTPTPMLTVYKVQRGTVTDQIAFPGKVILGEERELFFDTAGRVDEVYVDSGQEVVADQPIARLYSSIQEYDVADARMAVELAQERVRADEEDWEFTKRSADTELAIAQRSLMALQSMVSPDPLELFVQEQRVAQAQAEVDRLAQGVNSESAIQLQRAELALARAQQALTETRLTAPASGQVLFLAPLEQGATVSAFEALATLVDPESLQIEANLVAADMVSLYEGMPVTVSPTNQPSLVITGTISSLPQPIGTGIGTSTLIDLGGDNAADGLRPGGPVEVLAIKEQAVNVLWLPSELVLDPADNPRVMVREGGELKELAVKLGVRGEDRVEIKSGLQEGDEVLGG